MQRWFLRFLIVFFSFLSGFLPIKNNEQLFLRNVSRTIYQQAVAGVASTSAQQRFINSQVRVLNIGVAKNDLSTSEEKKTEWGKSHQVDTYTWTINVGQDAKNATPQEIFAALNDYRKRNDRGELKWNDKLSEYAKERVAYFTKKNDLDAHEGFTDFINNNDGFRKLGFGIIGENSSFGYTLEGIHLIEWVYAADDPHNDNQLNSRWSHVGIGVEGTATDLIFAAKPL
jgi:uncharacterized protein YkwD